MHNVIVITVSQKNNKTQALCGRFLKHVAIVCASMADIWVVVFS